MSLVRLLTAGKTLVGLKDVSRRYRMPRPGAMPKFGSAQNPFHSTADAAPVTAAVQEKDAPPRHLSGPASNPLPTTSPAAAAPSLAEVPAAVESAAAPAPCVQPVGTRSTASPNIPPVSTSAEARPANNAGQSAVARSIGTRIGGTNGLFTGFGGLRQRLAEWVAMLLPRRRPAPPASPQSPRLPRQAELSLDEVRVVRNDLSDADLEVVPVRLARGPARARPQASAAPAVTPGLPSVGPSVAPAAPAGTTWSRVSAQLFGAGKT